MPALRNIPEKRIIANYSDFAQFIAQKVQEGDCPHADHAPTAMLLSLFTKSFRLLLPPICPCEKCECKI